MHIIYNGSSYKYHFSLFSLWHVMTLSLAGFEPAQRGHMCSSARRSNHDRWPNSWWPYWPLLNSLIPWVTIVWVYCHYSRVSSLLWQLYGIYCHCSNNVISSVTIVRTVWLKFRNVSRVNKERHKQDRAAMSVHYFYVFGVSNSIHAMSAGLDPNVDLEGNEQRKKMLHP